MSESSSGRYDLLDRLAEEFAGRYRRGERPAVQEYIDRHPELADDIRRMFAAVVQFERAEDDRRAGGEPAEGLVASPPRQVGDYRILREVGRGGMGVVYEAEQVSLGRRVALKVLPSRVFPDRVTLERFRREARSAAKLHHTNIVPVFEVGQAGEVSYYAMQFIQGQGLDRVIEELGRLRRGPRPDGAGGPGPAGRPGKATAPEVAPPRDRAVGQVARSLLTGRFDVPPVNDVSPLPGASTSPGSTVAAAEAPPAGPVPPPAAAAPDDAAASSAVLPGGAKLSSAETGHRHQYHLSVARIGQQAAEALAYAHARGVVHRDIKPSNLLLDTAGVVWLADFGLAKGEDEGLTQTGDILGTLRYMAPERFRGEGDGRADVYALGLTLYELLTLRPAFDSPDRLRLIEQVKSVEPVRPRAVDPRIPRALETVVLKAIDKDPLRRYQSAEGLAEDLRRFLAGEPIAARPAGPVEKAWRWTRRHPAAAGLIAATAVAGLALVAMVSSLAYSGQLRRANELAEQQRAIAEGARGQAQDALALARRYVYFLRVNQAGVAWRENALDRTAALLAECPPEQRDWEWHFLDQQCHSSLLDLKAPAVGVFGKVAYSPDGRHLASAGGDGTVRVWDAATGLELPPLTGHAGDVFGVTYSPDGRHLASAGGDGTVRVWDAATGQEVHTLTGHAGDVFGVTYSPDGRHLASAGGDGTVRVWDAATGQEVHTLTGHADTVWALAYSPDGRRIASASKDRTVRVWDATDGHVVLTPRGHDGGVYGVAYSPDGRRIASASADKSVRVWDAATGLELPPLTGHTDYVVGVAYSPDGRRIASTSFDRTVKIWDAESGQVVHTFRGHTDRVRALAYSPDGRRIASGGTDQTVKIWDATGQEVHTLTGHADQVWALAYSPDGRRIASASKDRTVRVWDAATGQEVLPPLTGHTDTIHGVAYSPDGRHIASASFDKTVRVWDAATGQEVLPPLTGHSGGVRGLVYSPDGRHLASPSDDGTVKIWDTTTGQVLTLTGHTDYLLGVAYSPDGRRIASASADRTVRVWDAATGQEVLPLTGHTGDVFAVAYSPDGRRIASASTDQTVKIWDAATGQEVLTLRGHTGGVRDVAYSRPDGRRIASASADRTVKIWDAATGQELLTLPGHTANVHDVAYSGPDGRHLASASFDGTVRVWDGTPVTPAWQAERVARADRNWPAWQGREAKECERQGRWFAALWHLNQLLARDPDDADLRARRDAARARIADQERQDQGSELPVDVFAK